MTQPSGKFTLEELETEHAALLPAREEMIFDFNNYFFSPPNIHPFQSPFSFDNTAHVGINKGVVIVLG
jgi:hypothetical protein